MLEQWVRSEPKETKKPAKQLPAPMDTAAAAAQSTSANEVPDETGRCRNGSLGIGGALHIPLPHLGPIGVGISGGMAVGFSFNGNFLDSRIFAQFQANVMAGTGIYGGVGLSGQYGTASVPAGIDASMTLHTEINVGMGVGGSLVLDSPLESGGGSLGGFHGRLPGGRLGVAVGGAAGMGVGQTTTVGAPTIRELLDAFGVDVDGARESENTCSN